MENERRKGERRVDPNGKLPIEVCDEAACFYNAPCGEESGLKGKGPLCRIVLGDLQKAMKEGTADKAVVEEVYNNHKIDRRSGEDRRKQEDTLDK